MLPRVENKKDSSLLFSGSIVIFSKLGGLNGHLTGLELTMKASLPISVNPYMFACSISIAWIQFQIILRIKVVLFKGEPHFKVERKGD